MKHNQITQVVGSWQRRMPRSPCLFPPRSFSSFSTGKQEYQPTRKDNECRKSVEQLKPSSETPQPRLRSIQDPGFWTCKSTWRRARINTLRCLVGCTIGDFSALWILQTFYPGLGMGVIMGASSNLSFPLFPSLQQSRRGTNYLGENNSGVRNNNLANPRNNPPPPWRGSTLMVDGSPHSNGYEYGLDAGHGSCREYR